MTTVLPERELLEREITERTALCLGNGRLNPRAVGFSRVPLLDTAGIGRGRFGRGRNKRWEYWAITTPTHILTVTTAALDYAAVHQVWVLDRRTGIEIDDSVVSPRSASAALPATLGGGPVRSLTPGVEISIDEITGGTRIRAWTKRVSIDLIADRPAGHESLSVVIPWSARLFQCTVKDIARPTHGRIVVDGAATSVTDNAWAVLDHGRGRWPATTTWNWAAASGISDGHVVGLQFGGLWTEGTGGTENAIFVDGVLHKISVELRWERTDATALSTWTLSGGGVQLEFTPFHERLSRTGFGGIGMNLDQVFGHFQGTVRTGTGESVRVDGLLGWIEHVRNRW